MMRIDNKTLFNKIRLITGEEKTGYFTLTRGCGDLGHASTVFVVSDNGDGVWPLSQVVELTPANERTS